MRLTISAASLGEMVKGKRRASDVVSIVLDILSRAEHRGVKWGIGYSGVGRMRWKPQSSGRDIRVVSVSSTGWRALSLLLLWKCLVSGALGSTGLSQLTTAFRLSGRGFRVR